MSLPRLILASALALLAAACDNTTSLGPLVPFSRPEHIAFACFAPRLGPDNTVDDDTEWDVLPQACCAERYDVELCDVRTTAGGMIVNEGVHGAPRLHALVTQSTRGEVAAVDMTRSQDERVLDSDSLIPGYTFLDSGGLPSAVVMPPKQPRAGDPAAGAKYTFVASAEEYQLRAIPACRFRSGRACGPELEVAEDDRLSDRLILPLPSAPGDMILGPDEALWVSLPELALLARVELAQPEEPGKSTPEAFAIDPATGRPKVPQFFRVPDAPVGEPPEPVPEAAVYAEVCGLGAPYQPREVSLPRAPRAPTAPMPPLRPKLLRHDLASGLLLVADAAAPVIHAFSLDESGTLVPRGALPTGAPIRDFALTGPVPVQVPRRPSGAPDALGAAAVEALESVRYLYAIDDRDGSVMVFAFAAEGGAAQLTPLLAPVPNARFADRLDLGEPVAALDVIDTRGHSALSCGEPFDPARVAPGSDPALALADFDTLQAGLRSSTGPSSLRGVFLAVASQSGVIALVDVYDMDLACRAEQDCNYATPPAGTAPGVAPLRPDLRAAVAVRRHTARRSAAGRLTANVSNDGLFASVGTCDPLTQVWPVNGEPRICAPSDPWYMVAESWSVQYQANLPGATSTSGALLGPAAAPLPIPEDALVLEAPGGLDLCGRGVLKDDLVTVAAAEVGARGQNDSCSTVGGDEDAELLEVIEAYRDRLVLRPRGDDRVRLAQRDRLLGCYPDFVRFDVRAARFLVLGSTYLSNVIAGPDGACVVDPERPLQTSRAVEEQRFTNPYLSFQLARGAASGMSSSGIRNAAITLGAGASALTNSLATGTFSDTLPATVRFYPGDNELYVVDSASQGLTRYNLNPFARAN